MSEPDIVAELDAWRENVPLNTAFPIDTASIAMTLVQRARDEIMALRKVQWEAITNQCREYVKHVRAEALEEAAQACEDHEGNYSHEYAAAIRALKDKP